MRKFGKESASPADAGGSGREERSSGGKGWLKNHWCALSICVIVIIAFLLRTVFAYGVSADGDFALSGGSGAQYHLHVIESILNGSYSLTDSAVNYPVGGLLVIPPLLDFIAAGVASVLSMTGMSTTVAASAAVGAINPIIGALTCIPVYLVGKELFDKRVGVVAALIFAFLALPISTSVFSNGNEYALAAFLMAFMSYFAVRMVHALDAEEYNQKKVLINAVIAGIFLALAALTWNGFRIILVLFIAFMVIQILVDRFRGKDFINTIMACSVVMLIGVIISALYYIPAGLWEEVFSGPVLITVVAIVFSLVFWAVRSKPWTVTIPALIIVFAIVAIVLFVAAPDYYQAFIYGNSTYSNPLMDDLVSNRVSMSNVASYYGWLTMWLPICLAIYEFYVYLRRDRSSTRLFTVLWLFVFFLSVWTSYANAAVIGSVFAVGSAAVIVKVLQRADLKSWYNSMKVAGFPGAFRKLIKPFPFASVIIVALLVIVPNFTFAVDAGMSTNADSDHFFSGNTQYTIRDGDSYPVGNLWDSYEDQPKDGALVTWIDYAYDAVAQGGFQSVTDTNGGGASAAAQIYMGDGSAGATAAMLMRLITSNDVSQFSSVLPADVYSTISGYIEDPMTAVDEIHANPSVYGKIRADITDENAIYLASVNCILTNMDEPSLMEAYDSACSITGEKISYILLDGSMLPLQYGDGDNFSTIAYFADYSVDQYGAATEFYTVNSYSGITQYKDAIYSTFLWRALIGPSAAQAGDFTSSYNYLVALATSDGTTKAQPGYGLSGYEVVYWQVQYNADDNATVSDDGWEYMDAYEAIAKQDSDGGVINYLSSIVMLKYVGMGGAQAETFSGTVTDSNGQAVNGATVSIYQYNETYGNFILVSEATTRNGNFTIAVPKGDYRMTVSVGEVVVASYNNGSLPTSAIQIPVATLNGAVKVGDNVYNSDMKIEMTGQSAGKTYEADITGQISIQGMLPDTYDYKVYDSTGTAISTGTVTVYPGNNTGFNAKPTTYNITATVKDVYDDSVTSGIAVATNTATGQQFSAPIEDGKAVIAVIPGSYIVNVADGYVSTNTTTSNASSGNKSVTITAYPSTTVAVSGLPAGVVATVSAGTFSTYTYNNGTQVEIPVSLANTSQDGTLFTAYAVVGNTVYTGVYNGSGSISMASIQGSAVTGTLKNGDNGASGTVQFINASSHATFTVAAGSDGSFTAILPAGTYVVAANNGSDKVYFGQVTVGSSFTDMGDISLNDGRKVSATFRYDAGSYENLGFAYAMVNFTYNDTAYTVYSLTGTNGSVEFYIPDDVDSVISINNAEGSFTNKYLSCTELLREISAGTSNNSGTVSIHEYDPEKEASEQDANYVIPVSFTPEYSMTLSGDGDYELTRGQATNVAPGEYDVTIDGSEGYYYDGKLVIRPGMTSADITIDAVQVATVTINSAESDNVEIQSEGAYHRGPGSSYYFEYGYEYFITSTNTVDSKETIAYGYVDLTTGSTGAVTVNATATQVANTITGYVGVVANGTMDVTFDNVKVQVDVTDGVYRMQLPANVTSVDYELYVTATIDSEECAFQTTGSLTGLTDGAVRNVTALTTEVRQDGEEELPDFTAEVTGGSFSNGTGTATVSIKNNTEQEMTYQITSGRAWSLTGAYSLTVPANGTGTVTVSGVYDANRVAPGSEGFTLTVVDINGGHSETVDVTVGGDASGSAGVTIAHGDGAKFNDKVSAYEYMYAITLVNSDPGAKTVTVDVSNIAGWYVTLMDESGSEIYGVNGQFTIYGLQTTVVYVKLMPVNGTTEGMTVPSVTATVHAGSQTETLSMEPVDASVTTDSMEASGDDIFNERSGVPSGIWFLLAVCVILLIAIFWLGSKRGVFSRRN